MPRVPCGFPKPRPGLVRPGDSPGTVSGGRPPSQPQRGEVRTVIQARPLSGRIVPPAMIVDSQRPDSLREDALFVGSGRIHAASERKTADQERWSVFREWKQDVQS